MDRINQFKTLIYPVYPLIHRVPGNSGLILFLSLAMNEQIANNIRFFDGPKLLKRDLPEAVEDHLRKLPVTHTPT